MYQKINPQPTRGYMKTNFVLLFFLKESLLVTSWFILMLIVCFLSYSVITNLQLTPKQLTDVTKKPVFDAWKLDYLPWRALHGVGYSTWGLGDDTNTKTKHAILEIGFSILNKPKQPEAKKKRVKYSRFFSLIKQKVGQRRINGISNQKKIN